MMKTLGRRSKKTSVADAKQDYDKRILDLESENEAFKQEIEKLKEKLGYVSSSPDSSTRNLEDQDKPRSAKKSPQQQKKEEETDNNEVLKLKAQKVKLQCKIKLDSVQFRLCKASLEKEILQLKKEKRRKELETHILLALNKRQKLMLQRKKTKVLSTLKQLKLSSKTSSHKAGGPAKGVSTKSQDAKHDLEVAMRLYEVHSNYERQMEEIAEEIRDFRLRADMLKADTLTEENSCSLLPDGQVDGTSVNSELNELKHEFSKLSILFSQIEMSKSQISECDRGQVGPSQSSGSNSSKFGSSNVEALPSMSSQPSPLEHSQGMVSTTKNIETKVCCSCSKRSSCKTPKCECRSARGGCSESCGCTASKCSNREASVKPVNSENDVEQVSYSDQTHKITETSDDSEPPKKQPLHDIGNLGAKPCPRKAVRRTKQQKTVAAAENY